MHDLQAVALGHEPADLVVEGGRVLRPGTDAFDDRDVLVLGDRIAAVVEAGASETSIAADTEVVDAAGRVVVPGFVDAHTHVDVDQPVETSYHRSLAGGTTTLIAEVQDVGGVLGPDAVEAVLEATADLPIRVFVTVPPQPLADTFDPPRANDAETERLCDLLGHDRVVGVGEIPWIHLVGQDSPIELLVERAREQGVPVSAHGAGCSGEKLAAFASQVDNDHEAISAEEIVERVENGIHAIGRSGAIRDDVAAVAGARGRVDPSTLSLASDGTSPRGLLEDGHVDAVLRRAIDAGVPPIDAVGMVTAVPARHFGLDCGSIAPGRPADLVVLSDFDDVRVDTVVSAGDVVVRAGEPLVEPRRHEYPQTFYETAAVRIEAEHFRVSDPGGPVRAIRYAGGLLSHETTVEPIADGGWLHADPERDLCKVTLFDRHLREDGGSFTGFVTGFGLEAGAIATTHTWETPGLLAIGTDDEAMRRAAERVADHGGGWSVVRDGTILADLPTPIGGLCSELPLPETADRLDAVREAIWSLGSDVDRPLLGVQTLTFPGVPSLKLTTAGYADVIQREVVGLDGS